ncbi:MAG: aminotransferase class IV, partial [Flavobacteriales bacterium]|nr:aminotransferase class IV [Flavobacteriales bacterium]
MSGFQLFNGELVREDAAVIQTTNRCFSYGDGFFESIRVSNSKPLFIEEHWKRIQLTADFLQILIPEEFSIFSFEKSIKLLCVKNEFKHARIRFHVFRIGRGKYTPTDNAFGWSMKVSELDSEHYRLNKKGLIVGVCSTHRINPKPQSSFKTSNSIPYVLGGMYAKQMNWDDCLMLDSAGFIAESTNSNIFVLKDNSVLTPDLSNGGVNGV